MFLSYTSVHCKTTITAVNRMPPHLPSHIVCTSLYLYCSVSECGCCCFLLFFPTWLALLWQFYCACTCCNDNKGFIPVPTQMCLDSLVTNILLCNNLFLFSWNDCRGPDSIKVLNFVEVDLLSWLCCLYDSLFATVAEKLNNLVYLYT